MILVVSFVVDSGDVVTTVVVSSVVVGALVSVGLSEVVTRVVSTVVVGTCVVSYNTNVNRSLHQNYLTNLFSKRDAYFLPLKVMDASLHIKKQNQIKIPTA